MTHDKATNDCNKSGYRGIYIVKESNQMEEIEIVRNKTSDYLKHVHSDDIPVPV